MLTLMDRDKKRVTIEVIMEESFSQYDEILTPNLAAFRDA
jgi:hypothetical protein